MNNRKFGFTLAEVLIVVSIIGVVAALTIPSLIDANQKRINIASARKAEYDVSQIALRLQAECPRFRCTDGDNLQTHLNNLTPQPNSNINYNNPTINNNGTITINVTIDDSGLNDLTYTLRPNGEIQKANTDAHHYICTHYENEQECP